ncbi:hypothetical protein GWI34_20955 [Actinomadura sp. DSM 109109]|nr:hypothetical protein [Actinomadura lepetitiana]
MGLDNPGGPGKGPETTDPPPSQPERPATPPAETNGQHSRLESLRLAREAQLQDNGTQPSPGKDNGTTPTEEPSESKASPAEADNGATNAEKTDQAETDEEPRQDEGERGADREAGESGRFETDQTGRNDDSGEEPPSQDSGNTADNPSPGREQTTPPTENPQYPPGSRLESLARAREEQQATAEQRRAEYEGTEATDRPGVATASDNRDGGAGPENENAGKDEPGHKAQPPSSELPTSDDTASGDAATVVGSDAPMPPTSGEGPERLAPEAARPQDQGHEPLPPQDSADLSDSGDVDSDPPPEPQTDGTAPADNQTRDGEDPPQPGAEVTEPAEPAAETGAETGAAVPEPGSETSPNGPENTVQGTEPPEPQAKDGTSGNETDEPQPTGASTPPPEGSGENVTPPEALGEQTSAHGRNAEDPQSIQPTDESNPPDHEAEPSGARERSGTELTPRQEEPTDVEPSRFAGQVTITLGRDGRPLPADRPGTDDEAAGRGELRRPEDDRASRDYQERDPDNPTPGKDTLRNFLLKADDAKDSAEKFTEPALKNFERVKPAGQSTARPNTDHIKAPDQNVKSGDVLLGAVGTVVVLAEAIRLGINLARRTRREHADH